MRAADYEREKLLEWAKTREKWREEVLKRGFGPKERRLASLAITQLVPKRERRRFRDFLETTGAGDHPAFVAFVLKVGQFLEEAAE